MRTAIERCAELVTPPGPEGNLRGATIGESAGEVIGVGQNGAAVMITNRSIPTATVIPVLVYPDVRAAVAWLADVFGFAERVRVGEDHRSQLQIGEDGAVIVADVRGEQQPPQAGVVTHLLKVRVADVDAQFERARSRGARVLERPTNREYGERDATVADLAGHRWQFTQTLRDVTPQEWGGSGTGWGDRRAADPPP